MADLLFGLPLRQRRARIYRYNDSILICSNQKLRTRYRFGRASIEYNTNLRDEFTEENKFLLRSETNRPSPDSTTILCKCWLTASSFSCRRYNWIRQIHRFTGSPWHGRHVENNHSANSRKIALWDTNCRPLARHCKWFLHHVLTVNQGLTNLPSNRTLNNVLKSSD